jgi:hypothetical protein
MEQTEEAARERLQRNERAAWVEISHAFVRNLQAVHNRIILNVQRAHTDMEAELADAERTYLQERAERLYQQFLEDQAIDRPVERHVARGRFLHHVKNRRDNEVRVQREEESHQAVVAATMRRRHETDATKLARLDSELESRVIREVSKPVHVAVPAPIVGEVNPKPILLSPLQYRRSTSKSSNHGSPNNRSSSSLTFRDFSASTSSPLLGATTASDAQLIDAVNDMLTPLRRRQAALPVSERRGGQMSSSPTTSASASPASRSAPAKVMRRFTELASSSAHSHLGEDSTSDVDLDATSKPSRRVVLVPIAMDMEKEREARDRTFRQAKVSHNVAINHAVHDVSRRRRRQDDHAYEEQCSRTELAKQEAEVERQKRAVMAVDRMINPNRKVRDVGPLNVVADRGRSIGESLQRMQEDRRDMIDAVIDVERGKIGDIVANRNEALKCFFTAKELRESGGGLCFPAPPGAQHPTQTQRHAVNNTVTQSSLLSSDELRRRLVEALRTGWNHNASPGTLDFSMLPAIGREGWSLAEKVLEVSPTIQSINLVGCRLTDKDCESLQRLILRFAQICNVVCELPTVAPSDALHSHQPKEGQNGDSVLNDDTTRAPPPPLPLSVTHTLFGRTSLEESDIIARRVLDFASENKELRMRRTRLEVAKAKKAELKDKEKDEASQLAAVRKRAHVAFEHLRDMIELQEDAWRYWMHHLEQSERREAIRVQMTLERAALRELLARLEKSRAHRETLEATELAVRDATEQLALRGLFVVRQMMLDEENSIAAVQRAYLKMQLGERQSLGDEERDLRMSIRRSEQQWRKKICVTQRNAEAIVIGEMNALREKLLHDSMTVVNRAIAAHLAALARQRAEEERQRIEAEKLRAKQALARDALDRSETAQRERVLYSEERTDRARLSERASALLAQYYRALARATRVEQRTQVNDMSLDVTVEGIPPMVHFAQGSMAPVPLIDPAVAIPAIHLRPLMLPRFMSAQLNAHQHKSKPTTIKNPRKDPHPHQPPTPQLHPTTNCEKRSGVPLWTPRCVF